MTNIEKKIFNLTELIAANLATMQEDGMAIGNSRIFEIYFVELMHVNRFYRQYCENPATFDKDMILYINRLVVKHKGLEKALI